MARQLLGFNKLAATNSATGDVNREGQPSALEETMVDAFKTNVVGNVHLINLFLPLIRKGSAKKIIAITSALAENDVTSMYDVEIAGPFCISKAALNHAICKLSAQHRRDGILLMSLSPGFVDTGHLAKGNYANQPAQPSLSYPQHAVVLIPFPPLPPNPFISLLELSLFGVIVLTRRVSFYRL